MSTWKYSNPLVTQKIACDECHGTLVHDDEPSDVSVYTREGTKFAQHFAKVCPNRWCRKRFYFGYSVKCGEKVYDRIEPKTDILITSNETAFKIDFLYEASLHFLHSNATFQGLSDVYNQFQNFRRENISRQNLVSKRLASGFFLYGFLEMTSRCGIFPKMSTEKDWLDDAILENYTMLKKVFSNIWSAPHECKIENCETMMVSDGGMKINRKLCAAKFSVVRKFQHIDKTVLTGCTAMPSPNSPFCKEHMKEESPVLLAENITATTRNKLWDLRSAKQQYNRNLPKDSVFIVETVMNARRNKNDLEYLVKFAGYPLEEACWEPVKNLPTFIVSHYQDKHNHGLPLPKPTVKRTVKIDDKTEVYHHLEWKSTNVDGDVLELKEGETLIDLDQDKLTEEELLSSCNTRKVKDKRDRRHTAGIFISASLCGRIPHVDELFSSESINQVHGSIIEYLGNINPDMRSKLKLWLFDDMCHLKPHSEKPKQANQNEVTKSFAELSKAVDKFHFPVHKKTDKYCQENCNPNTELKKLGILKLNSPACEQAFKWLNAFKNLKTMNEPRFKFFLIYMIDLHNLHLDNRVDLIANPLNPKREESVLELRITQVERDVAQPKKKLDTICELSVGLEQCLKISENSVEECFKDCYEEDPTGMLKCNYCPAAYKKEGHLRNHLESKHNKSFKINCSVCDKVFPDSSRLVRHKKNCK